MSWLRGFTAAILLPLTLVAASDDRSGERERMVREQLEARDIRDRATLRAMAQVPRHLFVPEPLRHRAYEDTPLPIGHGQTISQPYIVAFMTAAARLRPQSKVLEIGTGSGYQAAVLAQIAEQVYSIEIIPALAQRGHQALQASGAGHVQVRTGDGYDGWADAAPFDVIVVTAAAEAIPPPLVAQLAEDGRMLIPVGPRFGAQNLVLVTKRGGRVRTQTLLPVRFVPLVRGGS
jgi:protein-L-isoaspartate(D-aspartate) O-methyltransferase